MFSLPKAAKMWNTRYAGSEAFTSIDDKGYYQGSLNGRRQLKHRVIMALVNGEWPSSPVDHIDGDKTNNCLCNLRVVSTADNQRNQPISSRNKSGVVGVFWAPRESRWRASIGTRSLGLFRDMEEAIAARKKAEQIEGYHPNHGKRWKIVSCVS